MKKSLMILYSMILVFGVVGTANALPFTLTLESYSPATFSTISTVIDLPDMNDQLEISRQAALFALSPDGWDLGNMGLGEGFLQYREPPLWSGHLYFVNVPVALPVAADIEDLFGFPLTEFGGRNDPAYSLFFHTDEWVARLSHNIGESPNNFGVISGGMEGDAWHQAPVPDWGSFSVQAAPVPEPATIALLGSGLIGLVGFRRKLKK